jgi:hypothetical protein
MFCDGVDDDKAAPILCALPEETAKKLSSMKARPNPSGKVFYPAISRPRVTPEGAPLLITSSKSPLRLKRLLVLRAGSSEGTDGPHSPSHQTLTVGDRSRAKRARGARRDRSP